MQKVFSKFALMITSALVMSISPVSSLANTNIIWKNDLTESLSGSHPLVQLVPGGKATSIKLTGVDNIQYFDFAVRADELISDAQINLNFTPSPSLIANFSQINVYLNDQLQQSLRFEPNQLGKPSEASVRLDTKLIKAQNRLSIEFVGHYQTICENPENKVLWTSINPSSTLTLTRQKIRLGNDLSHFPAPFINTIGQDATTLPFVFAKSPSDTVKTAAAILASLGGQMTQWRGIDFPVYYNEAPPKSHFVVFATNDQRPDFLKNLPQVDGPQIIISDAPNSRFAKILIVTGRHDADLLLAVKAFASPDRLLIGERFKVKNFQETPTRAPYDAPTWLTTDKPIEFSQLMQYPQQLTSRGHKVMPIHLPLRLAPDLYMTGGSLDVSLKYRHTKPLVGDQAQLQVRLNDRLVESINLNAIHAQGQASIQLPAFEGSLGSAMQFGQSLKAINDLSFQLQYQSNHSEGSAENCKSVTLVSHQLEIDPNSTIRLSGLYHYANLPNLNLFTQSGFPFSKMADLSETAVLMPLNATAAELNTMFNTIGRIGAITGVTASKITVSSDVNAPSLMHKDILIVGEMPLGMVEFKNDQARELQQKVQTHLTQNKFNDKTIRTMMQEQAQIYADTGAASIVSIQSPFNPQRTVIALVSEGDSGHRNLHEAMSNPSSLALASGSVCILSAEQNTQCFAVGKTYFVGNLPWYQKIWTTVSKNPLILVMCAVLCAAIMGYGIFHYMRRWIRGRA